MRTLWGNLIGAPVIALVSWIYRTMRNLVYADVEGRYFEYKGNPINIIEGNGSERWLSFSDIRRTLTDLPRYATFQKIYPNGTRIDSAPATQWVESLALVDFLRKSQDPTTIRFLRWLQREVVFPAEKKQATHKP